MPQLQPVLWTKGLVLTPQHLQTQDRFFEESLGFRLAALSPWYWGFHRRSLDSAALGNGELVVLDAAGVFPDGTLFASPDADGRIPPRDISAAWGVDQLSLTAYLALPDSRSDGRNVAMLGEDAGTRFVADVVRRKDETNGLAERELQVARRNLRVIFGTESLEGHTVLPLARLTRTPSGEIVEDPSFIPPLLSLDASSRLLAIVDHLVEVVAARSAPLSSMRRQRSGNLAHFSVSDVASFWLLYTLNSYLPALRHFANRRRGHPSELYETLVDLAGSLTTFSHEVSAHDLPSYQHIDPGPAFLKLERLIRTLVQEAVPDSCVALAMRRVDSTVFGVSLDDERLLQPVGVYLALRAAGANEELMRQVPMLFKISSADRVTELIRLALPGARIAYTPAPPSAVPLRLGSHYYEIDRSGAEWEKVLRTRNLAVHVPSEFGEISMEIVVLLPSQP